MKKLQVIILRLTVIGVFGLFAATSLQAQDGCPADKVCLPQETANKLLSAVTELSEARVLIQKLLTERNASDAVIASAQRVIEDYKQLDAINVMQVAKYKDMMALYERVITLYASVVDKLEAQLNKPQSGWQKFLRIVEKVVMVLAGVTLGRGL